MSVENYLETFYIPIQIDSGEYSLENFLENVPRKILMYSNNDFCKFEYFEERFLEKILQATTDDFRKMAKKFGGVN